MTKNPPLTVGIRVCVKQTGGTTILRHYESLTSVREFQLAANALLLGLNRSDIKVGDSLIVDIGVNGAAVLARRPTKSFDTTGMTCLTGIVQNPKSQNEQVEVLCNVDGQKKRVNISSITPCFQAQQDPDLHQRIISGLKKGDSVNVWLAPSTQQCCTPVRYFSVNFR